MDMVLKKSATKKPRVPRTRGMPRIWLVLLALAMGLTSAAQLGLSQLAGEVQRIYVPSPTDVDDKSSVTKSGLLEARST